MEGEDTMKTKILLATLLILAVCVIPVAAINWGELDTEHTNVGAFVIDHPVYNVPYQICSGTLIHPKVFLTAGHCTDGFEDWDEGIWVNFDQNAVNEDTLLDVETVITHPEYAWGGNDPHDVGLLILEKPVKTTGKNGIQPATLPDLGYLNDLRAAGALHDGPYGAMFTVVGYGGTVEFPPPSVYYEDLRQVAESEYRSLEKVWLHLAQVYAQDMGGTCFGDSGGPVFWEENGDELLVALTSWGDAQCVATGFYYRTDIVQTKDFIDDVMTEYGLTW
jgi:secreted trypsin-like serine protease